MYQIYDISFTIILYYVNNTSISKKPTGPIEMFLVCSPHQVTNRIREATEHDGLKLPYWPLRLAYSNL